MAQSLPSSSARSKDILMLMEEIEPLFECTLGLHDEQSKVPNPEGEEGLCALCAFRSPWLLRRQPAIFGVNWRAPRPLKLLRSAFWRRSNFPQPTTTLEQAMERLHLIAKVDEGLEG